ncbi:MAG: CNNM domain-containing protein [Akkermansia sp.]
MEKHPEGIGSLLFLGVFVFGELVPKRVGMCAPEVISKLAAVPMKAFSCAAAPFVWVLSKSTVFACNLLGVRNTTDRVTEEEIRLMIQENARDGDIQDVECIFNLGDRDGSIITSRGGGDIAWLDAKMTEQPCGQGQRSVIRFRPYYKRIT